MTRLRNAALAGVGACLLASAFTLAVAAPASARSAPCINSQLGPYGQFYRCTSTSPNGAWRGTPCMAGANYNATNGPFNVYVGQNQCTVRVWLHQFTNWEGNNGWAYCISPNTGVLIPSWAVNPNNIYVSTNRSAC